MTLRCTNCDAALATEHRYCWRCGQKAGQARLTMREIGHNLMHALLHVDRSIVSLLRAPALRPGQVATEYVSGRRRRYFGPFAFLVIVVGLASAVMALAGFRAFTSDTRNVVGDVLQRHVNIVILLQAPRAAFCALLFRGHGINFVEHLVLAAGGRPGLVCLALRPHDNACVRGLFVRLGGVLRIGGGAVLRRRPPRRVDQGNPGHGARAG